MPRPTPKSPIVESDPTPDNPTDNPTGESDPTAADTSAAETGATAPEPAADVPAAPGTGDTPPAPAPQEAATEAATETVAVPEPDEHGRYRVRDLDTGHELTIHAAALPHGRFQVLTDEPASDPRSGEPLPPVHAATPESPVEPTTSGQEAENKEKLDA